MLVKGSQKRGAWAIVEILNAEVCLVMLNGGNIAMDGGCSTW